MKHDVLVSGRPTATVLVVAVAAALTTGKESRADAISELLDGKKISISVRCEYDQSGNLEVGLNSRRNLTFKEIRGKPIEIVNSKARVNLWEYSATVRGNELTVYRTPKNTPFGESNRPSCGSLISLTNTIQVSGSSCSATHSVCNGGAAEMDDSCKAVSCTVANVAPAARPDVPVTAPSVPPSAQPPATAGTPSVPDEASRKRTANNPQLIRGLTQQQCTARGGKITTYTNTAGRGSAVGECLVPPSADSAGGTAPAGGAQSGSQGGPSSAPSVTVPIPTLQPPPAAGPGPKVASAPIPPREMSGASGAPPAASSSSPRSGPFYQPVLRKEDCPRASELDRSTYAYFLICEWDGKPAQQMPSSRYSAKSPVDPEQLSKRAEAACPLGVNMNSRQQQSCLERFKIDTLLREEPAVRAECAAVQRRKDQDVCAHVVYLYGPGSSRNLRLVLSVANGGRYSSDALDPGTPWRPEPKPQEAVDGCQLGYGLKPPPGGFGSRSCQPLSQDVEWAKLGQQPAEAAQEFEDRVNDIAALATAAVDKAAGAPTSAPEREACIRAAYAAARGVFKGGASPFSARCQAMVFAAMREVPLIADASVMTPNRGVNEVLDGYLALRNASTGGSLGGNLGPPLPGMTGLQPLPIANCTDAADHWKSAEKINTLEAYQDHLSRFEFCNFATLAKARIAQLQNK